MTQVLPLIQEHSGRSAPAAEAGALTVAGAKPARAEAAGVPLPGTLLEALASGSKRAGAVALLAPGRAPLSHKRLLREILQAGAALAAIGLGRGSRVAIVLPSGPEMALALLAVAGHATAAPLDPAAEERSWPDLLRSLRLDAVLVPDGTPSPAANAAREVGLQIVRLAPSEREPAGTFTLLCEAPRPETPVASPRREDVAMLLRTSGTVSAPKVVPLTQAQIVARPERALLRSSDRGLCVSPLYTATALGTNLLGALLEGASVVVPPAFRAERLVAWLREFQPTYVTASATMLATLLDIARAQALAGPHSLRFLRSTSNALPAGLQRELEAVFGVPVIQAYSMTETGAIAENPLPPGIRKHGSVGLPVADVVIAGDTGLLPPDAPGEILVRGPRVMSGYEDSAEANEAAFRNGWFRTGDQGYFDADGYLFLTGRTRELINRGGVKVSPHEVDDVLLGHPAVLDAAAFPAPHPTLGEDVAAAVVLREPGSATAAELRAFCLERLARFKAPGRIHFVSDLPRNGVGKLQRGALTAKLGAAPHGGAQEFVPPHDAIAVQLVRIWERLLGRYPIGVTDDFFELGGDSLLAAQVVERVNQLFERDLPVDVLWQGGRDIATLAATLRAQGRRSSPLWSRAVALRADGPRRPLFCAPVEGGHLFFYDNLARYLDPDRPVYALPAQGIDGREPPHTSIEAMSAHAIRLMREVQPFGPYALLGYCSGAVVAFEMARQLEAAGDAVERLMLIDSVAPGASCRSWWLLALDAARGRNVRLLQERLYHGVLDSLGLGRLRRLEKLGEAHRWARWSYRPRPFAGSALLIRPTTVRSSREDALGWRRLVTGGVEVRELAGTHGALVTVTGAARLAAELEPWLR